jgi:ubiquinone/menaquinone biosynthesis C-methylase UbiE
MTNDKFAMTNCIDPLLNEKTHMLARALEPELMDTAENAAQYDAMDHSAVNAVFVNDLLLAYADVLRVDWSRIRPCWVKPERRTNRILDLGAGTAQILVELARRSPHSHITAVDAAQKMFEVARTNIADANLVDSIELVLADAKQLPFEDASFDIVISNSIVHHIPAPCDVIEEAIRVTATGGLLFHRDLARPSNEAELERLVATYTGNANAYQQKLFGDSLRAALTAREMADLVAEFGFARDTVRMTSDRHWTWTARKL